MSRLYLRLHRVFTMNKIRYPLRQELNSSTALYPWVSHTSSSRLQMFGSHISQHLTIQGGEPRRNQTMAEREFGKATFRVEIPCNALILDIIPRIPRREGAHQPRFNPSDLVIFLNMDIDGYELDCVDMPRYHSVHQSFGFSYKKTAVGSRLQVNQTIPAGTVLADSPSIDANGNYCYGAEVNLALMTIPGVTEDGCVISRSMAKRLTAKGQQRRTATWGSNFIAINLYGDETRYQPLPNIGEPIHSSGLLMALRKVDPLLSPVEMTPKALMTPDYTFDRLVYGKAGAIVSDIRVISSNPHGSNTLTGMDDQIVLYYNLQRQYHQRIIEAVNQARRQYPNIRLSPSLHNVMKDALLYQPAKEKNKATHMYQRVPLDDWFVEVAFEYDIVPGRASKITTAGGGVKGVICDVWEDEDMPVDANGIRAHAIMDPDAIMKRTSMGVPYEQYTNATSHHLTEAVRQGLDLNNPESVQYWWERVLNYYQILSPRMYAAIISPEYQGSPEAHLKTIVERGIYLYLPTDNEQSQLDAMRRLREEYPIPITPVTYRGVSGDLVTTKDSVLIGSVYMLVLDKTGDDFAAVASPRTQHFGLPAKLTKQDRYAHAYREQPGRFTGETEVRILTSYVGGKTTGKLMEMSTNPLMHKHVVRNILRSPTPTNLKSAVNWEKFPNRGARAYVYLTHILQCAGIQLHYKPYFHSEVQHAV